MDIRPNHPAPLEPISGAPSVTAEHSLSSTFITDARAAWIIEKEG